MGYIYSYVNKSKNNKTYIGSRCSYKGTPEEDFNIKYFSSSSNPEFWEDLKNGQLEGQILLEVSDPEECVKLENLMIKAYWEQYGRENSYNFRYIIGDKNQFSTKGKHPSEETRQKMSEVRKGKPAWNKGQHRSKETIEKISAANKGKHHSEESKRKMSEARKGRTPWNKGKTNIFSEETKKKLSKIHKGRYHSEESKKKMSILHSGENNPMYGRIKEKNPFYNKHHSEEIRKKISETLKGKIRLKQKWLTPDGEIKEMNISNVKQWHPDWKLYEK